MTDDVPPGSSEHPSGTDRPKAPGSPSSRPSTYKPAAGASMRVRSRHPDSAPSGTLPLFKADSVPPVRSPLTNSAPQVKASIVRLPSAHSSRGTKVVGSAPSVIRIERKGRADLIVRYRQPDMLAQLPRGISILAWGTAALALMFYDNARPRPHGLDRFFSFYRSTEGQGAQQLALVFTALALLLSLLGLWVNSKRMRRRSDRYNRSLIALAVASAAGVLAQSLR